MVLLRERHEMERRAGERHEIGERHEMTQVTHIRIRSDMQRHERRGGRLEEAVSTPREMVLWEVRRRSRMRGEEAVCYERRAARLHATASAQLSPVNTLRSLQTRAVDGAVQSTRAILRFFKFLLA